VRIPQLAAEVARVRISHDLARVTARAEHCSDQLVEAELFGTRQLDGAVQWPSGGNAIHHSSHAVSRHRLNEHSRHPTL
jgi:hypothetical protein